MHRLWWALPLVVAASCKKPPEPVAPALGWHQEEGWVGSCYAPPDFSQMGGGGRRMERQETLEAMMSQWKGDRDDGVMFDPVAIENVETALLSFPEKIEALATDNHAQCARAMSGKGTDGWEEWLVESPRKLLEGECRRPLGDTLFNYLDIGIDWQFEASVCDDNRIKITATTGDEYRVDDGGPWINASGDAAQPARGEDYPCTTEGCLVGQLVLRFRGDSGVTIIKPIGISTIFDPPEHGRIDIMINDTSFFNNEYRIKGGIQHHTGVTYEPVE